MRILFVIVIAMCISLITYSQGKKTIKRNGVKERVEWRYDYVDGNDEKVKESYKKYDNNGNEIELIEYDEDEKITKHTKTKYNQNSDPLEIVYYKANGTIKKTVKYKYQGELKTEKQTFNSKGKLSSKKVYEYTRY